MVKMRFVCATRFSAEQFATQAALGQSIKMYEGYRFMQLRLFPSNKAGLSSVYNTALREAETEPAVLIFVHDDVHLLDFSWPMHVLEALQAFDVVGLVGNKRRVPRQPAWAFIDDKFTWDDYANFSGILAHGGGLPIENLSIYGMPRQEVKLLDGVFLAARSETLIQRGVRFDERFEFHFYDMDFCRQAESKALRMGTCSVSALHVSRGSFETPQWRAGYQRYLDKWQS